MDNIIIEYFISTQTTLEIVAQWHGTEMVEKFSMCIIWIWKFYENFFYTFPAITAIENLIQLVFQTKLMKIYWIFHIPQYSI